MKTDKKFLAAYEAHADAIFRFCYYRVFERDIAHDLTQETFLKTWKQISDGTKIDNIKAWLYRVAQNLVIDYVRKKKESSLEELQADGFNPHNDDHLKLIDELDSDAALKLIRTLDPPYREALLLKFVDGFSPREIAQQTGETANVISVRINRGLKEIKRLYEKNI